MTDGDEADLTMAAELHEFGERLRRHSGAKYDLLATMLQALVPLRMHELSNHTRQQLVTKGRAQVETIAACGDNILFRGPNTRAAFSALLTAIACGALLAEGGITVLGLHWCAAPHAYCPASPASPRSGEAWA